MITNKLNLPEVFYNAVKNDGYNPGDSDITVTQLKDPPRMIALRKQFAGELSEDCADRGYALLGQAVHAILERAAEPEAITEHRYYSEVLGWKLGGQIDHLKNGILTDFKVTSSYVAKGHVSGEKNDWHCQLNALAYLLRKNDVGIKELQVFTLLRDWSKLEVLRDNSGNYPRYQVQTIKIPLWSPQKARGWVFERVGLHQQALKELPLCTAEDRWKRGDKWAVMKEGRKSALRVLGNEIDAQMWAIENNWAAAWGDNDPKGDVEFAPKTGISIVHRPGEAIRCQNYCSVADHCTQFQGERK